MVVRAARRRTWARTFGDNLTVSGVDFDTVERGQIWRIGSAVFAATTPREPVSNSEFAWGQPSSSSASKRPTVSACTSRFWRRAISARATKSGSSPPQP